MSTARNASGARHAVCQAVAKVARPARDRAIGPQKLREHRDLLRFLCVSVTPHASLTLLAVPNGALRQKNWLDLSHSRRFVRRRPVPMTHRVASRVLVSQRCALGGASRGASTSAPASEKGPSVDPRDPASRSIAADRCDRDYRAAGDRGQQRQSAPRDCDCAA